MKREYKDLELETVTFEDVITASGDGCKKDCPTFKLPCRVYMPCPDAFPG